MDKKNSTLSQDEIASPFIPLPNEIPTSGPSQIIHSGSNSAAIESLIQQNAELTARLTVNLRRLAEIESINEKLQNDIKRIKALREATVEELEMSYKKHEVLLSNQKLALYQKEQIEKQFAEFKESQEQLVKSLNECCSELIRQRNTYRNFHNRIKRNIKPIWKALHVEVNEYKSIQPRFKALENFKRRVQYYVRPLINKLKLRLQEAEKQNALLTEENKQITQEILKLSTTLQEKHTTYQNDLNRIVEFHESRFKNTNESLQKITKDYEALDQTYKTLKADFEKVSAKAIDLENKTIYSQRQLKAIELRSHNEISELQQKALQFQQLWSETNKKCQIQEAQLNSSLKLNQKLNDDMSRLRRENEKLREELRSKSTIQAQASKPTSHPQLEPINDRIDTILKELHTGSIKQKDFSQDPKTIEMSEVGDLL